MPKPSDSLDLRRAHESAIIDALGAGQPLALAEAYHRTVPAAHAVARRLMSGADDVEDLLLAAYAQLWESPPSTGPLEGWVRRTVWTLGVDRLRAAGTAPSSPSLAGLVPDLPAPDVRFLDAAERAIAELPDDERRALLLAHDKGVPTSGQEPGAAQALGRALLALAGPEASAADRTVMEEDPCTDLAPLGDWCLGVASSREEAEVTEALDTRPGCAARSRAARRGRRRIEGLPATPDMGQRVLVSVLVGGGAATAGARGGVAASPDVVIVPDVVTVQDDQQGEEQGELPTDVRSAAPDPFMSLDETGPLQPVAVEEDLLAPVDRGEDEDLVDPFADAPGADGPGVLDTADLPGSDAADTADAADAADAADMAEGGDAPRGGAGWMAGTSDAAVEDRTSTTDGTAEDDPFAPVGTDTGAGGVAAAEDPHQDWRPDPGSTAELRLSDILAEGDGDDDDPFAALDDEDEDLVPSGRGSGTGNPYSALRDLDDAPPTPLPGDATMTMPTPARGHDPVDDGDLVGGYVEGQEDASSGAGRPSPVAAVLAWILPILGGTALGILVAITVFGLPS